ncbi:hypothetical protein SBOR_4864 [Sclerotinia borealis F-4128]|uniref:2EXR domain-containing protein n=1 Tax=Sclerotinia borealis (strain F-4128) TaxID=1432307 RepID=W9CD94_SCLBF|nr:hypothetical protein SBOR_4864 [Sclerotinia borealis F-4128]
MMATEFHNFPNLPTELRRKIWSFCIPDGRVMELDCPSREIFETRCVMGWTSIANALQPAFSLVCRESRDVAFTNGGFLWDLHKSCKDKGFEQDPIWNDMSLLDNPWFYPETDTVHLNWDEEYAATYDVNDDPFPPSSRIPSSLGGGSFMAELMHPFQKEYKYRSGRPMLLDNAHNFPLREHMDEFKVCLIVINIHATATQAVDAKPEEIFEEMILTPDDFESRVRRWHEEIERIWLWHKCSTKFDDGTLGTVPSPENIWTGPELNHNVTKIWMMGIRMPQNDLNRAHLWVQATLDDMPRFRSVIMFRYCNAKCHTQGRPKPLSGTVSEIPVVHDYNHYMRETDDSLTPYLTILEGRLS